MRLYDVAQIVDWRAAATPDGELGAAPRPRSRLESGRRLVPHRQSVPGSGMLHAGEMPEDFCPMPFARLMAGLAALVVLASVAHGAPAPPEARAGLLDLSGWNFAR